MAALKNLPWVTASVSDTMAASATPTTVGATTGTGVCAPPQASDADRPKTLHQDTGFTGFIIKSDVTFNKLIGAFEDTSADPSGSSRRAQEKDPSETHRQLQLRATRFNSGTSRRKDV